jgi:hypothetical protein
MEPAYTVEFRDDHVHVQLGKGFQVDPEWRDEVWENVRKVCEERGSRRVLVEGYVPNGDRSSDEVIAAGERAGTVPKLWLAFHLENFEPTEQSELFEAIAASRGVRVRFFGEPEDALSWLRANASR